MQSTTTIRLGDLQDRVAAAAERAGKSVHGFMVDAIAESVMRHEQRAEFVDDAITRRQRFLATGRFVSFDEMQQFAQSTVREEVPSKHRLTSKRKPRPDEG